jgi:hypothetical protein
MLGPTAVYEDVNIITIHPMVGSCGDGDVPLSSIPTDYLE